MWLHRPLIGGVGLLSEGIFDNIPRAQVSLASLTFFPQRRFRHEGYLSYFEAVHVRLTFWKPIVTAIAPGPQLRDPEHV